MIKPDDTESGLRKSPMTFLSEKTGIQVGLMIAVCGFLWYASWWGSAMQSKLDTVIEELRGTKTTMVTVQENNYRIKTLENKMSDIEAKIKANEVRLLALELRPCFKQ